VGGWVGCSFGRWTNDFFWKGKGGVASNKKQRKERKKEKKERKERKPKDNVCNNQQHVRPGSWERPAHKPPKGNVNPPAEE